MNPIRTPLVVGVALLVGVVLAWPAIAPVGAQPASQANAKTALPYERTDRSLGVVNCANSLCHGSVRPFKQSNVLQTEYVTWSRVDKHARAYQVLSNEQSQRIARNLGIEDPRQAKICLDCHVHNVPASQRGDRFKLEDGVSCEACHGPAGGWLAVHVADGATHDKNLKAGLFDTADAPSRARLCLSCHFGNADRFVSHRMMGAGHPRMSFELDTFTVVEPAHFKIDADWEKRKRLWNGVKVWAIGQAVAVSEMMGVLADPKRSHDGMFPELVLFDCHACHHPMSERRWAPRVAGLGPGVVRLNDSSMLMARQIAKVADPAFGARVADTMNDLQQSAAGRGGDTATVARKVKGDMEELVAMLDSRNFGEAEMRAVLASLIDDGINGQYRDYAGAEQATMAIGSVASFMYKQKVLTSAQDVNAGLAALQAAVRDDERYVPAQFEAALRNFRGVAGL
jgi:cytochrome c554/c'-like protein